VGVILSTMEGCAWRAWRRGARTGAVCVYDGGEACCCRQQHAGSGAHRECHPGGSTVLVPVAVQHCTAGDRCCRCGGVGQFTRPATLLGWPRVGSAAADPAGRQQRLLGDKDGSACQAATIDALPTPPTVVVATRQRPPACVLLPIRMRLCLKRVLAASATARSQEPADRVHEPTGGLRGCARGWVWLVATRKRAFARVSTRCRRCCGARPPWWCGTTARVHAWIWATRAGATRPAETAASGTGM